MMRSGLFKNVRQEERHILAAIPCTHRNQAKRFPQREVNWLVGESAKPRRVAERTVLQSAEITAGNAAELAVVPSRSCAPGSGLAFVHV